MVIGMWSPPGMDFASYGRKAHRGEYRSECAEQEEELWLFASRSWLVWAV
jgi:hypothetical protein